MCYIGTVYKLRLRHSLEPQIDGIPYFGNDSKLPNFTLDELRSACQKIDITHMQIDGDIPHSLHKII